MPGFSAYAPNQRIQRRPKNNLDKCTVVSVFPLPIVDYKPTAFPQTHRIEAAGDNDFSILVVGSAGWFKEMGDDQPFLEIPIQSYEVAEAMIRDFSNGLLEYVPGVAEPGLFYLPGAYNKENIKKVKSPDVTDDNGHILKPGETFDDLLAQAREKQRRWFGNIVRLADTDWARSNGNPRSISELQKIAANKLQLKDKAWLADFNTIQKTSCNACGFLVNPAYPICPNCKAIVNEERAKALNIKFAG